MARFVRHAIIEVLRADTELDPVVPLEYPEQKTLVGILEEAAPADDYPPEEHFFHRSAPQDAAFPFVIVSKQSGVTEYSLGTGDHCYYEDELWTVKGVDKAGGASKAEELDERIRAVLQDAELQLDGWDQLWFRKASDVDMGELEEGAQVHHSGAIYALMRERA